MQTLMGDSGVPLWTFIVRDKRSDGITPSTKHTIVNWWAIETRVSPNKSDLTWKRLKARVFDKKPTHFLMETQVWIPLTLCTMF